jgi:hypothetical protein
MYLKTCCDTTHNDGNEVVKIAVGRGRQFECAGVDLVKSPCHRYRKSHPRYRPIDELSVAL